MRYDYPPDLAEENQAWARKVMHWSGNGAFFMFGFLALWALRTWVLPDEADPILVVVAIALMSCSVVYSVIVIRLQLGWRKWRREAEEIIASRAE